MLTPREADEAAAVTHSRIHNLSCASQTHVKDTNQVRFIKIYKTASISGAREISI